MDERPTTPRAGHRIPRPGVGRNRQTARFRKRLRAIRRAHGSLWHRGRPGSLTARQARRQPRRHHRHHRRRRAGPVHAHPLARRPPRTTTDGRGRSARRPRAGRFEKGGPVKRPPPSRERGRPPKSGHRRALSHLGGPVETRGLEEVAVRLATIMGGDMDADGARAHVHGFHAYPARMHPTLARRAIELMSPMGGTVLDPFCGSGTVLVESRLAARQSWGVDLNPLAVLLARLKSRGATPQELQFILSTAGKVAQHADSRRREKRGATRRYPAEDVQLFDPHVLLELDGLRDGLGQLHGEFVRDALRLVFSAILVKVSRQPGDTSTTSVPRRLAAGFTIAL
ncbi:MAG: hypothetical protein CVU63_22025, partial [Deltaproteobacteria bacterium HGW-Deltaproteobacteria-20]